MEEKDLKEFVSVEDRLPESLPKGEAHMKYVLCITKEYGLLLGFYFDGMFMSSYAHKILNVIKWAYVFDSDEPKIINEID
jgi:hypothetical protein